jgi:hypothetical protein
MRSTGWMELASSLRRTSTPPNHNTADVVVAATQVGSIAKSNSCLQARSKNTNHNSNTTSAIGRKHGQQQIGDPLTQHPHPAHTNGCTRHHARTHELQLHYAQSTKQHLHSAITLYTRPSHTTYPIHVTFPTNDGTRLTIREHIPHTIAGQNQNAVLALLGRQAAAVLQHHAQIRIGDPRLRFE